MSNIQCQDRSENMTPRNTSRNWTLYLVLSFLIIKWSQYWLLNAFSITNVKSLCVDLYFTVSFRMPWRKVKSIKYLPNSKTNRSGVTSNTVSSTFTLGMRIRSKILLQNQLQFTFCKFSKKYGSTNLSISWHHSECGVCCLWTFRISTISRSLSQKESV